MCFRAESGIVRSCLALDTFPISSRTSPAGLADGFVSGSFETCIFFPDLNLRFKLAACSPTGNNIGVTNLCMQVQNLGKSVDFTRNGAIIFKLCLLPDI